MGELWLCLRAYLWAPSWPNGHASKETKSPRVTTAVHVYPRRRVRVCTCLRGEEAEAAGYTCMPRQENHFGGGGSEGQTVNAHARLALLAGAVAAATSIPLRRHALRMSDAHSVEGERNTDREEAEL